MNPYWNNNFFSFFVTLFHRLKGDLSQDHLPSDEVQLIVLAGVGLSCALIGTFLTLKKMTMLANSLSHTLLLGIAAACFILSTVEISLTVLFIAALASALLTTLLTQFFTHTLKLQEDASIGLVFTILFALGIVFVTLYTKNAHIGIEAIMGNADALHADDIRLILITLGINLFTCTLFYKEFKMTAFDSSLATSMGISSTLFNTLLMLLTSLTAIAAFRAIGAILVLALLVGPVLIARLWTSRLRPHIFLSCAIGVFASAVGVASARHILSVHHFPLSTGGLISTLLGLPYLLSLTLRRFRGLIPS